ncbi:MAG: JAB domain-containing protein [Archangium sp.]
MDNDWLLTTKVTERVPVLKPADDAQRRLIRLGPTALSNPELLSLLLRGEDAVKRAAALTEGGLRALMHESPEALQEHHRLDAKEVARVLAAGELARRLHLSPEERPRLQSPAAIHEWARRMLVGLRREEVHVLCFNSRSFLLRHVRVSEGASDQCYVDPREVLAPAVACRASSLVLLHNHPSGDPEPSVLDVTLTRQLKEGARLLCMRLVDHLVISERGFVSMLQRGLLTNDGTSYVPEMQSP